MSIFSRSFEIRLSHFQIFLSIVFILIISVFLTSEFGLAQSGGASSVQDFDTNGNGIIDNIEFFAAVDQWLAGEVENALFFSVVDAWIAGDAWSSNGGPPPSAPPLSEPMCPTSARLVVLQNGVPVSSLFEVPVGALNIAFAEDVYLPKGTNLELRIVSDRAGLSPTAAGIGAPFIQGNITPLGQLEVLGIATVRDGANVPRNHEWARFTPVFSAGETSGNISISGVFRAPGCRDVRMSGGVRVAAPVVSALDLIELKAIPQGITLAAIGEAQIQVELFDLSGSSTFKSVYASAITMSSHRIGRQLANGIYLYVVRVRAADGFMLQSGVQKIVLIR